MGSNFNIIGKVDLNAINNPGRFRLLSLTVSFGHQETVTFDFGINVDELEPNYRYFSLLIGNNGAGKSSLLHETVEFFVDADKGDNTRDKNYINILSVAYEQDYSIYRIERNKSGFRYYKNDDEVDRSIVSIPLIIATTSGMFDKFPIKKKPLKEKNTGKIKEDRYDVPFYKYVGPKVNNNMFMSKTNLMLQHLSGMNTIRHRRQLTKIAKLLDFIGYEAKLSIKYKAKDIKNTGKNSKLDDLTVELRDIFKNVPTTRFQEEKLLFRSSTLQEVRSMHLAELCELRQRGFLSSLKCSFYRVNNKIVDCNNLSSGEFNILSIGMSVILSAEDKNTLILLDEPEISQHPNWQRDMIENLDMALEDYNCHFLIATHSHLLVSNLPANRSSVIHMDKNGDKVSLKLIEANTYGWSPEEVLLKVFEMTTDRNRYLAEMVGIFIKQISEDSISFENAKEKIAFLNKVSEGLSEVDPLKKVILAITEEFEEYG